MMNLEDNKNINHLAAHLFRENTGKMTAVLSRFYGIENLDNITDVIQDTFESALVKWRYSGIPDNPSAWLMKVVKNKMINFLKRENKTTLVTENSKAITVSEPDFSFSDSEITDSQLQLLLACCRINLSHRKQIIITLNILCGFGVSEIANALLMADEAVKKALYRTKNDLKNTPQLFSNQKKEAIRNHIALLQTIVYLLFNEGYKTTRDKKGINIDLCYEAIRLAKMIREHDSDNAETNALIAMMFFNIARFPSRITANGEWLTLAEQDRTLWNHTFIEEGFYYLDQAKPETVINLYYLEAMIASIHCSAPEFTVTDWHKIVYLYRQMERLQPDAHFIRLNRIIAESHIAVSDKHFEEMELLENLLGEENRFVFLASKGYLYERIGDLSLAKAFYAGALSNAKQEMDRTFMLKKMALEL